MSLAPPTMLKPQKRLTALIQRSLIRQTLIRQTRMPRARRLLKKKASKKRTRRRSVEGAAGTIEAAARNRNGSQHGLVNPSRMVWCVQVTRRVSEGPSLRLANTSGYLIVRPIDVTSFVALFDWKHRLANGPGILRATSKTGGSRRITRRIFHRTNQR